MSDDSLPRHEVSTSGCTWIVSEPGERWRRAVDRVAPPLFGDRFERLCVGPGEIVETVQRRLPSAARRVVVLCELPLEHPGDSLAAIARCAALDRPPLQLIAVPQELPAEGPAELELAAGLRLLGAAAVLRHPEQLWQFARLVARYAKTDA
ncbi:hypothetical protein [Candidatus Laterigemmans baculatus]|uniref:hypothetical protein n=1 Tax=Candidatus Laterigemmans baculatus TaxID=2770505 RepID=UPI0013DC5B98|nr:hypothetical protein [Candidatus Laterigemmans baculatus]